jgi:hypothetical protein
MHGTGASYNRNHDELLNVPQLIERLRTQSPKNASTATKIPATIPPPTWLTYVYYPDHGSCVKRIIKCLCFQIPRMTRQYGWARQTITPTHSPGQSESAWNTSTLLEGGQCDRLAAGGNPLTRPRVGLVVGVKRLAMETTERSTNKSHSKGWADTSRLDFLSCLSSKIIQVGYHESG